MKHNRSTLVLFIATLGALTMLVFLPAPYAARAVSALMCWIVLVVVGAFLFQCAEERAARG